VICKVEDPPQGLAVEELLINALAPCLPTVETFTTTALPDVIVLPSSVRKELVKVLELAHTASEFVDPLPPTVPPPAGVAHVPSPRQKVDDDALVPEFKCDTPRFPVTSVAKLIFVTVLAEPSIALLVSVWVSVVPTIAPTGAATEDVRVVDDPAIGICPVVSPEMPLEGATPLVPLQVQAEPTRKANAPEPDPEQGLDPGVPSLT